MPYIITFFTFLFTFSRTFLETECPGMDSVEFGRLPKTKSTKIYFTSFQNFPCVFHRKGKKEKKSVFYPEKDLHLLPSPFFFFFFSFLFSFLSFFFYHPYLILFLKILLITCRKLLPLILMLRLPDNRIQHYYQDCEIETVKLIWFWH